MTNPHNIPAAPDRTFDNILPHVRRVIVEQMGVHETEVTPDSDIQDDLGADSLDVVEIMMAMEEEFAVSISDTEMEGARTVSHAVKLILEASKNPPRP